MKQCQSCKETKPSDCFYKNRARDDGLSDRCVSCCKIEAIRSPKKRPCATCGAERNTSASYCRPCQARWARDWRARHRKRHLETQRRSDKKRYSTNTNKWSAKRRDRHIRWKKENPGLYKAQALAKYHRTRRRAIDRLGNRCACCGEHRYTMLQIDHINNDGYIERAGRTAYSGRLARKVLVAIDPSLRYQILCANCNHSKARNSGTCEHKTEKRIDRFDRFKRRFDQHLAETIGAA